MSKKIFSGVLIVVMLLTTSISAFALPKPKSAYYPRGGMLTLSPAKERNNTYAFRPERKSDSKVILCLNGASAHAERLYNEMCKWE